MVLLLLGVEAWIVILGVLGVSKDGATIVGLLLLGVEAWIVVRVLELLVLVAVLAGPDVAVETAPSTSGKKHQCLELNACFASLHICFEFICKLINLPSIFDIRHLLQANIIPSDPCWAPSFSCPRLKLLPALWRMRKCLVCFPFAIRIVEELSIKYVVGLAGLSVSHEVHHSGGHGKDQ